MTPSKHKTVAFKHSAEVEPVESSPSPVGKSPRSGEQKQNKQNQFYTFTTMICYVSSFVTESV